METFATTQTLSNLQLELLRIYTRQISDEDLLVIRKMLADYFAKKAMDLADKVWDNNNWTSTDTKRLSAEHNRKTRNQ